jgi:hypothetical protein
MLFREMINVYSERELSQMHPADKIQSSFNIQEGGVVHTAIIVFLNG